jgi:glutaminyl-peptide cyclotransferase
MRRWHSIVAGLVLLLAGCSSPSSSASEVPATTDQGGSVAQLQVEVLDQYPHDTAAFTQGLELHEGLLYESTGLYGESDARIVTPETGEVVSLVELPDSVFGEGMTIVDDRIWQITWQEQTAFLRDRADLAELDQVSYTGEGWGICYDADREQLVMSDGTPQLTFRDPISFEPTGTVTVTRDGQAVQRINELECVGDRVWANIWQTDEIVRIDHATGTVDAVVDASGLLTDEERASADVLNGIAAAPGFGGAASEEADTFLITGKLWPHLFLVRFTPAGT